METGPLTVLGERPSLVDPLVAKLLARISKHAASGEGDLEIEARIGCLQKSREKLVLPVHSETVLPPPTNALHFEFSSDVGQTTFSAIRKHLLEISRGESSAPHPLFKISKTTESETVDEFYEQQGGDRIRVTSRAGAPEDILEMMVKKRLELLDVYSGSVEGEGEDRPYDLRLSVNSERQIRNFTRDGSVTARREKKRTKFELKGFVIDMTEVKVRDKRGDRTSYEVEVELKTNLLMEQLQRKQQGQSHFVYELLTDFVYATRDLSHSFPPSSSTGGTSLLPDLTSTKPSDEAIKKYLRVVGNVQPILGDYLYRVADELKPID